MPSCSLCQVPAPESLLEQAHEFAFWRRQDGACPACVQQELLITLLRNGDEALHRTVQSRWPLDPEAAFGALPTPLRLHADPRFTGRGVTLALVDSGFYPHPDLVRPVNRIVAHVDAGVPGPVVNWFAADDVPAWSGWDRGADHQWHGTMTSVAAAGNGWLSHGLYRGLASEARVVLVKARTDEGHITNESICRSLDWLIAHQARLGLGVVSLSVSGDPVGRGEYDGVAGRIERLVERGVVVVAAAGNAGQRHLLPPASSPAALTVGGLDDHNLLSHDAVALWHSNYGESARGKLKPELVAPSIWVVAPVLPGTEAWHEARRLFEDRRRGLGDGDITGRKLVTPDYQHVDGTSFAAPIVASTVATMLEARPGLRPWQIRDLLVSTASRVPGAPPERQGAGAVEPGRAVAAALAERHGTVPVRLSPTIEQAGVRFALHDHQTSGVVVFGSWNGWTSGLAAGKEQDGLWRTEPIPLPPGAYAYKFQLAEGQWLADPDNPDRTPDGQGGLNALLLLA